MLYSNFRNLMQQFWSRTHSTRPRTAPSTTTVEKPIARSHQEIAALAYSYWEQRGRQGGSAMEDWFRAERELQQLKR